MKTLITTLPKLRLTILLLTIHSLCFSQLKNREKLFPGSNLKISLSDNFKPSDNAPGFEEADGNTKIYGFQTKLELPFEDAIKEQVQSIARSGFVLKDNKKINHNAFEAVLLEYEIPNTGFKGLILLFGKANVQNIISAVFPKGRRDELAGILMSTRIDMDVAPVSKNLLGFDSIDKSGTLIKKDIGTLAITYEERNETGELIGNLKITKYPMDNFQNSTAAECIETISSKFFPEHTLIESDDDFKFKTLKNSGSKRVIKTIKKNGSPQYNYLVFVKLDKFDILIIGSANLLERAKFMDEISKEIKLK